jgi:hypothetical protein
MKVGAALIFLFGSVLTGFSQNGAVTRNVYLRRDPSTKHESITKLVPPAKVQLIEAGPISGFYHVKIGHQEGWVWGRNIKIATEFAAAAAASVTTSIPGSWKKYNPQVSHFTNADGTVCADGGDIHDRTTYRYKDRTDTAADHRDSYHLITPAAIRALPYFSNEPTRYLDGFIVAADRDAVMKYQGAPVELDAYMLDDLRPEHAEATNCGSNAASDVDWHLVVGEKGQAIAKSVFVEITARLRRTHSHWKKTDFRKGAHLKIYGWLMYGPDHKDQMTTHKRGTLWEVHPIVKVWKVQPNGSWADLDDPH